MENLSVNESMLQWLLNSYLFIKVLIGFSIIIFVHELGHFAAAKWMGVRVDRFALGFFYRVCGYRRGEGFTFGPRPTYKPEELTARGFGETDYCINALPFGGYVKMLGEDDIVVNEETGEVKPSADPRAFTNKSVGRRMVVVSAGVICNMLFAVLVYAAIFLFLGARKFAPVVGVVDMGGAAASANVQAGDRFTEIDGAPIESLDDLGIAAAVAKAPLRVRVERNGVLLDKEITVAAGARAGSLTELLGISPVYTTTVNRELRALSDPRGLQTGDRITRVDEWPVATLYELIVAVERCGGRPLEFTIERPDPRQPGQAQTLTLVQHASLVLGPASDELAAQPAADTRHLLGLLRRSRVESVEPGGPAAEAGFKVGDVVAQWGNIANPLLGDITASNEKSVDTPIPVVVERDGQPVSLTVTPRRPFSLFGTRAARVGVGFGGEEDRPVVADVVADTPAAELGLPRGAELCAVDEQPVHTWAAAFEVLRAAAGRTVTVRSRAGTEELVGRMQVPSSIVNELQLPPSAQIKAINGETKVRLESGREVALPATRAVQELLRRNVGNTVTVTWLSSFLDARQETSTFTVRADNTDPWQMRGQYRFDPEILRCFEPSMVVVTAHGNPLAALQMGVQQTGRVLWSVYAVLRSMLSPRGRVGVQDVSGPLGIVRVAMQHAEASMGDLLSFMAYISVNLAVINFIPLPVVDGGVMMFLLLEKIRRKPMNLKVQVVTTLVGLGLIVLAFVLVTFQDVVKWMSGTL